MTAGLDRLGETDVADAVTVVAGLDEPRWWVHDFRQRSSPEAHGATQAIVLRFHRCRLSIVDNELLAALGPLLARVHAIVAAHADARPVAAGNALVVRLPAGAEVGEHIDDSRYLKAVRRVHVPLLVNDGCTFTVAGVEHRPVPGVVYELANTLPHAAANRGPSARIHLISDWLVEGDQVVTSREPGR